MKKGSTSVGPDWLEAATARRALPLWLALGALVSGAYLMVARLGYGVTGFPLDDAWIHQTYARNLATIGQWAFMPGQTSAGSTSPLWSLLLSLGYWLGLPFRAWTYGLGIITLGLTGWTLARLGTRLFPAMPWVGPLAGLFCVLEWHLVWAAVSGMETILYVWLSVLVVALWLLMDESDPLPATGHRLPAIGRIGRWWGLGFLGGLLVLTRPEGLGLIGLIGLAVGWRLRRTPNHLLRVWLAIGVGVILPVAPYLTFHYATTGLPFPNTLYAKQQEYRILLTLYPIWRRWLTVAGVTLIGAQVLLLPGFVYGVWRAISNRESATASLLLPAAWWFAHLTVYALRLPVTYQHGRYQVPVLPFYLLLGVGGMAHLLRPGARRMLPRVLNRATIASTVLVCLAFLGLGARAYATDVAFIQGEMVVIARWLEENTPPDSLIAVHDIGAVGYFTPRPLLDLAGLITPEVIPFITDEERLLEFIQAQGADYVVFFPDWSNAYQRMAQDPHLQVVYTTRFEWTLRQGRNNMTVYRLQSP